jgi:hypothetical protein
MPEAAAQLRPALRMLAGRGQRLISCPLLDAALELFQRCRCSASWMPNDPYHLADAATLTANHRSPSGEGRTLALSAATVTEHVRDSGHEVTGPKASLSRVKKVHAGWAQEFHGVAYSRTDSRQAKGCPLVHLDERQHPAQLRARHWRSVRVRRYWAGDVAGARRARARHYELGGEASRRLRRKGRTREGPALSWSSGSPAYGSEIVM